jgi:hypothetical protein
VLHLARVCDVSARRAEAIELYQRALALSDENGLHADARAGIAAAYVAKPKAAPPDASSLARFAGTYDNGQVSVRIALEPSGVLTVTQGGRPPAALEWIEGARFRVAGATEYVFTFTGEPTVTGLDLAIGDATYHVPRTP